jgi:hypothetical protein
MGLDAEMPEELSLCYCTNLQAIRVSEETIISQAAVMVERGLSWRICNAWSVQYDNNVKEKQTRTAWGCGTERWTSW